MERAAFSVILAALALWAPGAGSLEMETRSVADLAGEPHIVSAAGLTAGDTPLLTIENPSPFDVDKKLHVVIIGGADNDERCARAALDAVRWYKTKAPAAVRERWNLSALPLADLANPHVRRWVDFQAPDLLVEIDAIGDTGGSINAAPLAADDAELGRVSLTTTSASEALETIRQKLMSQEVARSSLHDALVKRVWRDPLAVARTLAMRYPQTPSISYIPALAWVNTLRLAPIVGDDSLRRKVHEQTQPWLSNEKPLFGNPILLTAVAGTMIFADLGASGDAAAGALAMQGAPLASAQKDSGIAQYGQGWTDDMFMGSAILARTGRMPGREGDLDRAARLLTGYAARLQRPDGIFVHAADGPFAWGRGNGFAALGLMEVLTALPERHDARARVLDIYRRQMAGVQAMQAPDGMWRQVVDEPGAYREETATAMLLAAMARGVRLGWIDATYANTVRRAWRALSAHIADEGSLVDVCAGTGAGPTKRYYLDRPAIAGFDDRGGAMALLASIEAYELSRTK